MLPAAPAFADEADSSGPRVQEYLPEDILVIGERKGYESEDGSTATKTQTPLIDVPQAVYVLTEEQLDDQGVRSLGDALRYAPGVSLESGEGHRDEVFIRGQETTADFFVDGLRDDAQYYRPLYNIDRVEVLKGANALIFGRGGGGGVINRVTKTADPLDTFIALDGTVDSFGAFAVAADVSEPLSDTAGIRLNATYEEFANHRDEYDGRFFGISPTLSFEVGPQTTLTASYTYDDDERVTDRGIPSLGNRPIQGYDEVFFGQPGFNTSDVQVNIGRVRVDHVFSPRLRGNIAFQYADYDKFYSNIVPTGATETTVDLGGYADGTERQNFVGQANIIGDFDTGPLHHKFLLGTEVVASDTLSFRDRVRFASGLTTETVDLAQTISVPAFSTEFQRRRSSDLLVTSFYAQDQIALGDTIDLVLGVRYDEFDLEADVQDASGAVTGTTTRLDSRWSPRVGVIVKPVETVSLYASYTESFLPQSGDQFVTLSQQQQALEPELFENVELGAKWAPRPDLFLTAAVFRLTRSNTTAVDPVNPGLVVLTGESQVEGFEASIAGKLAPGLQANLAYTYLDGEITSDSDFADEGTRLQQLPRHQVAAWARYDVTPVVGIGAGVIHQSDQFASFANNVVLPAYTRVDAALFWDVSETLDLQLNVENLFDTDYYPSAHGNNNIAPGAPLNASITARVKF
ncbi:TonB-dependent siderophore receptor [Alteriqipengyuania sp. WL0013]|uniref:TonB-dependent receptor n=1 Tax=Alteriqipengyuania sp. WL0013 TaxID=3110773 RepID=UPI002BA1DBEE|nr:TonB-dependent siderophore receptor [Alteriqipengyuania sp. WL0013]MEB3416715.1 TonB-dependent siderophore receptor [Alteriqipengyuania sp. WL0013]